MAVPNSVGPNNVPFVIGYLMLGVFIPRRPDRGMLRTPVGRYMCYVPALSAGREGSTFDSAHPHRSPFASSTVSCHLRICHVDRNKLLWHSSFTNIVVIFSGYTVFTRHNAIWAKLNDDWGFSIGPWATLGVFCLAFLALLAQQGWSLQIPPLLKVDLHDGMAVLVADEKKQNGWFEKMVRWILDKL